MDNRIEIVEMFDRLDRINEIIRLVTDAINDEHFDDVKKFGRELELNGKKLYRRLSETKHVQNLFRINHLIGNVNNRADNARLFIASGNFNFAFDCISDLHNDSSELKRLLEMEIEYNKNEDYGSAEANTRDENKQ